MIHRNPDSSRHPLAAAVIGALMLNSSAALIASRVQASRMRDVGPSDVMRLRPPARRSSYPRWTLWGKPLQLNGAQLMIVLPPCDSCLASHLPLAQLRKVRSKRLLICLQEPLARLPSRIRKVIAGSGARCFEAGNGFPDSLLLLAPCGATLTPDKRAARFIDGSLLAEFLEEDR